MLPKIICLTGILIQLVFFNKLSKGGKMDCSLILSSKESNDETLQAFTRELVSCLNSETDIKAAVPEQEPAKGERGDPVSIGTLGLTFLTSGSAVALFQVIKSFFERNKSLEVSIKKSDGREFAIRAENLSSGQISESLSALQIFCSEES